MNKHVTLILVLFIAAITTTSCQETKQKEEKDLLTGQFDTKEIASCNCLEIQMDSTNTFYKDSILYTGNCLSYYPNSKKVMEKKPFLKGKIHGDYVIYDMESGDELSSVKYNNGIMEGDNKNQNEQCNCNDVVLTKKKTTNEDFWLYKNRSYTGTCYSYGYDSVTVVLEKNFKEGKVHGDMMIYDNEGQLIQMLKYKNGKEVKSKVFLD